MSTITEGNTSGFEVTEDEPRPDGPTVAQESYAATLGAAIAVLATPDDPTEARKWIKTLLRAAKTVGFQNMDRESYHRAEQVLIASGLLDHLRVLSYEAMNEDEASDIASAIAEPFGDASFGPNGWTPA